MLRLNMNGEPYTKNMKMLNKCDSVKNLITVARVLLAADIAWHGTSASIGQEIEDDGILQPRQSQTGNWDSGMFGGEPSNPDLVYVALERDMAEDYMKDIARKNNDDGALITVEINWDEAVPDEDAVFETLNNESNSSIWQAYKEVWDADSIDEAQQIFNHRIGNPEISDSSQAEDMKNTAEMMTKVLSESELQDFFDNSLVVAFSEPLKVKEVEYYKI